MIEQTIASRRIERHRGDALHLCKAASVGLRTMVSSADAMGPLPNCNAARDSEQDGLVRVPRIPLRRNQWHNENRGSVPVWRLWDRLLWTLGAPF